MTQALVPWTIPPVILSSLGKVPQLIQSRYSLLRENSILRNLGLYGYYIHQEGAGTPESGVVVCFGGCFYWASQLLIPNTCELLLRFVIRDKRWKLNCGIQVQHRVSAESPLMIACERGDVDWIRQILEERQGGINDQIAYSGKTPLLVR